MKIKDIIVGQKYKHKDFPNTIYLGCGEEVGVGRYKRKCVIIIKDDDLGDDSEYSMRGFIVKHNIFNRNFFSKFYPIP